MSARHLLGLALIVYGCGSSSESSAPRHDAGTGGSAGSAGSAGSTGNGGTSGTAGTGGAAGSPFDAGDDAPLPDAGCTSGAHVTELRDCLAQSGPDACLAQVTANLCDTDGDGLADDLETAIGRAYAPVYAFNGGAFGGNPETDWPASHEHFILHSNLVYRPDGQSNLIVDPAPTPASVALATSSGHHADLPQAGEGSDFWLCLTDSTDATRVTSRALMLALPDGIDLVSVIHPANGLLSQSSHVFAFFYLMFAYNAHSLVDDHEGDWEGIGVFVNRATGAVDAAWFERHDTTDNTRFIDVATYGAKDPAQDTPAGDVNGSKSNLHGVRFFDYSGARRHVVAFVGTGGHAMYDYPANTYIATLGPRDTHDGDADKLLPWLGELVPGWSDSSSTPLVVTLSNAGEVGSIVPDWAHFRGQWGCDDGLVGKSWPGPFGNARHARPLLEKTWGSPPAP